MADKVKKPWLVEAFMENGDFSWIKLDNEYPIISDSTRTRDKAKLMEILEKEKAKDSTVIGVLDSKVARILIKNTGKYRGIVWAGRAPLSGKWTS